MASKIISRDSPIRVGAVVVFFTALWFVLCRDLSGEWSLNEQYNYGWFVPFFALYLFWLRWEARPATEVRHGEWSRRDASDIDGRVERPKERERMSQSVLRRIRGPGSAVGTRIVAIVITILALLLLLPVRVFEIGNPDWRPLGWIHAAAVATITLIYIWYAGGKPWLRHFAFPIAFFFVAVPWISPIEEPIMQGLMRAVAAVAAETVTLFGIPAQLQGNLIRLSSGLVGVNEACSGVRSLQTSLMIGLLFGELKRLSISRRLLLVAGAIFIALAANFLRAIFLVWIAASKGLSETNRWHDLAGYVIVALVFVGSLLLAAMLARKKVGEKSKPHFDSLSPENSPATRAGLTVHVAASPPAPFYFLLCALLWLVAVEFAAASWYRSHEGNLVTSARWEVQWPKSAPNFRDIKIDEEVRRTLRFDQGQAASWVPPAIRLPDGERATKSKSLTCSLFFFRWNPGKNSALLANLHRPDVCLPAVGWTQVADTGVKNYPAGDSLALPFRHFEFRHGTREDSMQQVAHAFYCLWEDRAPAALNRESLMANPPSAWTRSERITAVLEGRRHLGQQVMELVVQTRGPLDLDQVEAKFAQDLPNLIKVE